MDGSDTIISSYEGSDSRHAQQAALDFSSHLSLLARSRMTSPLKSMFKYMQEPGILMLAGGLPSPDYFPFESLSAQVLLPNTFKTNSPSYLASIWSYLTSPVTTAISVPKYAPNPTPTSLQLSTALQYGTAAGLPALQAFIKEFVGKVFKPNYGDWETILNAGSTDAWSKICTMLGERGDGILCEEWTYPSALAAAFPSGLSPVAIGMDGQGLSPVSLDETLRNWNSSERNGMRRPKILYTVPVCQNPTGASMSWERKQEVYKVCQEWDVIIVEDDPYYFLQAGDYSLPADRFNSQSKTHKNKTETDDEFLASLIPSYLRCDTDGRVIRIDTFSKTICPGSRLGFLTLNPLFAERMMRANECSTQAPCGFGQVIVTKLLVEEWGMTGYLRWLKGLKAQYRDRRDMLVDSLLSIAHASLEARQSTISLSAFSQHPSLRAGGKLIELRSKNGDRSDEKGFRTNGGKGDEETLLSFVAPQGGMFVWLRIHFSLLPPPTRDSPIQTTQQQIMELWELLAKANVLVAPGNMFSGRTFGEGSGVPEKALGGAEEEVQEVGGDGYFRMAFSTASPEDMKSAMTILARVVAEYFEERM